MIQIYQKINEKITEIKELEKDCWVNISPPFNMDRLEEFAKEIEIPFSFIVDCIDLYERSRYEKVEDAKLIVINTPILNDSNSCSYFSRDFVPGVPYFLSI